MQESCELFTSLYRTWSHNPIATIALCLLTGCYRHAGKFEWRIFSMLRKLLIYFITSLKSVFRLTLKSFLRIQGDLVRVISDQEVTLEMLTELDRLVQLIESPIFTCKYPHLSFKIFIILYHTQQQMIQKRIINPT